VGCVDEESVVVKGEYVCKTADPSERFLRLPDPLTSLVFLGLAVAAIVLGPSAGIRQKSLRRVGARSPSPRRTRLQIADFSKPRQSLSSPFRAKTIDGSMS